MILIIYTWFLLNLWRWCDGNLYKLAWKDKTYSGIKPIHTAAIGGRNKPVAGAPDFHNYYHGQKDKTFKIWPKNVLHQVHVKCPPRQFIKFKIRSSLARTCISYGNIIKGIRSWFWKYKAKWMGWWLFPWSNKQKCFKTVKR